MLDQKKKRQTTTKEERLVRLENATQYAAELAAREKAERDLKTAKLKALRLERADDQASSV